MSLGERWISAHPQCYEWEEEKEEEQVQIVDVKSKGLIDLRWEVKYKEVGIEDEPQVQDLAT